MDLEEAQVGSESAYWHHGNVRVGPVIKRE